MPDNKVFSDAFSPVAVQLWSLDMHLDIPTIPGRRRSNSRTAKARPNGMVYVRARCGFGDWDLWLGGA